MREEALSGCERISGRPYLPEGSPAGNYHQLVRAMTRGWRRLRRHRVAGLPSARVR